jgi:hypothetical protein
MLRQPDNYTVAAIAELTTMSEMELQARVVEPMLRQMGFSHVRDVSGANDRGKDLIAIKEEFGRPKLYAVQLKKLQATGKHTESVALTHVMVQLRQTMTEPVIDPSTNSYRVPDRCIFISINILL